MKKFKEILESKEKIYILQIVGNFKTKDEAASERLSSIFILADSPENALKLAKKNIKVISKMFQTHKWRNGFPAMEKGDKSPVRIWGSGKIEDARLNRDDNVLTSKNKFEKVDLRK